LVFRAGFNHSLFLGTQGLSGFPLGLHCSRKRRKPRKAPFPGAKEPNFGQPFLFGRGFWGQRGKRPPPKAPKRHLWEHPFNFGPFFPPFPGGAGEFICPPRLEFERFKFPFFPGANFFFSKNPAPVLKFRKGFFQTFFPQFLTNPLSAGPFPGLGFSPGGGFPGFFPPGFFPQFSFGDFFPGVPKNSPVFPQFFWRAGIFFSPGGGARDSPHF